jgi:hypothetical protein
MWPFVDLTFPSSKFADMMCVSALLRSLTNCREQMHGLCIKRPSPQPNNRPVHAKFAYQAGARDLPSLRLGGVRS